MTPDPTRPAPRAPRDQEIAQRAAEAEREKWEAHTATLMDRIAERDALLAEMAEALIWCYGSADFGPGGQAHLGWERGPQTVLARYERMRSPGATEAPRPPIGQREPAACPNPGAKAAVTSLGGATGDSSHPDEHRWTQIAGGAMRCLVCGVVMESTGPEGGPGGAAAVHTSPPASREPSGVTGRSLPTTDAGGGASGLLPPGWTMSANQWRAHVAARDREILRLKARMTEIATASGRSSRYAKAEIARLRGLLETSPGATQDREAVRVEPVSSPGPGGAPGLLAFPGNFRDVSEAQIHALRWARRIYSRFVYAYARSVIRQAIKDVALGRRVVVFKGGSLEEEDETTSPSAPPAEREAGSLRMQEEQPEAGARSELKSGAPKEGVHAALRDLDAWRAKARLADLSLSPAGLANAHYLLMELLGATDPDRGAGPVDKAVPPASRVPGPSTPPTAGEVARSDPRVAGGRGPDNASSRCGSTPPSAAPCPVCENAGCEMSGAPSGGASPGKTMTGARLEEGRGDTTRNAPDAGPGPGRRAEAGDPESPASEPLPVFTLSVGLTQRDMDILNAALNQARLQGFRAAREAAAEDPGAARLKSGAPSGVASATADTTASGSERPQEGPATREATASGDKNIKAQVSTSAGASPASEPPSRSPDEWAEWLFQEKRPCDCGAVDIGVGVMHEPGCGLPRPEHVADIVRTAMAQARREGALEMRERCVEWIGEHVSGNAGAALRHAMEEP